MQNVRIRSTRDAHQIFFGVARKVVPLITRRLDAEERRAIVPGNVYVWEERGSNNEATGLGMERWSVRSFRDSGIDNLTKHTGLMAWVGARAEFAMWVLIGYV